MLADKYPGDIVVPTRLLAALEDRIAADRDLAGCYLSGCSLLRDHAQRLEAFLKVDSHLTPFGTWLVFSEVMRRLGYDPGPAPAFTRHRATFGDMTERFFSLNFLDCRAEMDVGVPDPFHASARRTYAFAPAVGHIGMAESWTNPTAPIAASLLVFGNSFSGPAGKQQNSLSWWLARWFQSYHFVWAPGLSDALVAKLRPDIVLCQTIEWFLPDVPPA